MENENVTDLKEYNAEKVTIYMKNEFFGNIVKHEAKLFQTFKAQYAQYPSINFFHAIFKNKRTKYEIHEDGYDPFLVIVKGWNRPEPDDMMKVISTKEDVTVSQSTYKCFDKRYVTDFDKILNSFSESDILIKSVRD
jgi:hypothetical protein